MVTAQNAMDVVPVSTWALDAPGHDDLMTAEAETGLGPWYGTGREERALARPTTTNVLPCEVRAALRRSDMKASKLLGVTVTRDNCALLTTNSSTNAHLDENENISPSTFSGRLRSKSKSKANSKVHSKSSSLSALAGALRNMNMYMHMRVRRGVLGVGKAKKRSEQKQGPMRVVLASLGPNVSRAIEGEREEAERRELYGTDGKAELEIDDGDDYPPCDAYKQLDEGSSGSASASVIGTTTSESDTLGRGNGEEEDKMTSESVPFKWDVENPFATPTSSPVRVVRFENISPLDRSRRDDHEFYADMGLDLDSCRRERRARSARRRSRVKTLQILGTEALDTILGLDDGGHAMET